MKGRNVMARHGENIRKRKDGRWEGRILKYNEKKGKQMYHSIYAQTYNEVREKMIMQKGLIKNPEYKTTSNKDENLTQITSKDILIKDAALEWLKEIKSKRKLSTYVKYQLLFQNHLENNFQDVTLAELTADFIRIKFSDSVSNNLLKNLYNILNQILTFASDRYNFNLPKIENPVPAIQRKPIQVISMSEQKKLLSVLYRNTDIYKSAVLLCLFTGIRLGELCALKWTDIDFENNIITINRTVQRLYVEGHKTKTTLIETTPKSQCSKREIPLTTEAIELLSEIHNDMEYVFGCNKPMEPRTLQYHFKKILKEAMLEDINFHVLRHTFATNCIENGTDVKSLSEILGHSNVHITLNRYVHPSMETKRHYLNNLSRFYGQIQGQAS